MPKQSRLGDDASIYQPLKQQTEREKLREMSFKGKLGYLREYYKFHFFALLAVIALIIYSVYTFTHPTPTPQFTAAMIDNTIATTVIEQYSTDFATHLQLNPKRETVELNTTYNFSSDDIYAVQMKEALITFVQAKQIDVIIAPESQFTDYATKGFFAKLSDKLPTSIYSSLTDQFYLTVTEDDAQKSAYGIYLTDTKLYKNNSISSEPYILGIVLNSPHEDNTNEFIQYLFQEK
jgi:hypothetical protein